MSPLFFAFKDCDSVLSIGQRWSKASEAVKSAPGGWMRTFTSQRTCLTSCDRGKLLNGCTCFLICETEIITLVSHKSEIEK